MGIFNEISKCTARGVASSGRYLPRHDEGHSPRTGQGGTLCEQINKLKTLPFLGTAYAGGKNIMLSLWSRRETFLYETGSMFNVFI